MQWICALANLPECNHGQAGNTNGTTLPPFWILKRVRETEGGGDTPGPEENPIGERRSAKEPKVEELSLESGAVNNRRRNSCVAMVNRTTDSCKEK